MLSLLLVVSFVFDVCRGWEAEVQLLLSGLARNAWASGDLLGSSLSIVTSLSNEVHVWYTPPTPSLHVEEW